MNLLNFIYDVLVDGYFYVVLILLLAYLFLKKQRLFLKEVIISSNVLSIFTYFIFICYSLYTIYPLLHYTKQEGYASLLYRIAGPYSYVFWIRFINSLALFILLLFKKTRSSIWITVWILISTAPFIYEQLIIWITMQFRDYIPSSWSVYHRDFFHNYPWLTYLLTLTVTHFIRQFFMKRKTPESANLQQ